MKRGQSQIMKLIFAVLILSATALYAQAQSKSHRSAGIGQELMQLQRAEDEAEAKKDVAALDRLLSDDFIFTAPTGAVSDKKHLIEDIKNDSPANSQTVSYDDVKAYLYGQSAVVNYLLIVKGTDKEKKEYTNRYRNTVVWLKQHGRWRMAAIHVSRIRP